ncbi:unnamed protein product [Heterosigma akashiwo]
MFCFFLMAFSTLIQPSHQQESVVVPTAIFHGMGDSCSNSGMNQIAEMVANGTGAYAECIEIGNGAFTSIFQSFKKQAEAACQKLQLNPHFSDSKSFNVMGLSQGGLISRYVAQYCFLGDDGERKVRNIISIGGPNMGVAAVPQCSNGLICDVINWVVRRVVYTSQIQSLIGPAGYFRDPWHYDQYLTKSIFLPHLNQEGDEQVNKQTVHGRWKKEEETGSLAYINAMMLVMFEDDTQIYPKETAWFQQIDQSGAIMALNESAFYSSGSIGFKELDEQGKISYVSLPGNHLRFTLDDLLKKFIPFLKQ